MNDEPETVSEVPPQGVEYNEVLEYRQAAALLCDDDVTWAEKREAVKTLEKLWDKGFVSAAYHLGKAYRDGLGVLPDDEKAEKVVPMLCRDRGRTVTVRSGKVSPKARTNRRCSGVV